ncbi:MAG: hypothetical protein NXI24_12005 [bacterium]|nr:hypothetical protein [bacterium]
MRSPVLYLVLILSYAGAAIVGSLRAQTPLDPESRAALYESPQDLIDGAVVAQLEQDLAGAAPDYEQIQSTARAELDRYYAQFIHEKRTADERRDPSLSYGNLDANALRLLILREDQEYARSEFQGESPYLFRLHRILGRVYSEPGYAPDFRRALREYAAALRYTGRPLPALLANIGTPVLPTADGAPDPAANPVATGVPADRQIARERIYMAMLRGFADPNRIAQESNANVAEAARNFRVLLDQYRLLKPELSEAIRGISVAEAAAVRRIPGVPTVAQARATLAQTQARFDQLSADLEGIRTGPYQEYRDRDRRIEGDVAYRMALLSRDLELGNKNRERNERRSSYKRGIGDQAGIDRTPHRDFPGYRMLLQLAHGLDPLNLTYLDLLTEDFRTSRRLRPAIAFQERFLELALAAQNTAGNPGVADLHRHYLRLGGMYSDERNRIRAATAFQEYLDRAPAAERGTSEFLQIQLGLADLHFEHTGRLPAAEELYQTVLAARGDAPAGPAAFEARARFHAETFRIQDRLAAIRRRNYRGEQEREALNAARTAYAEIETEYEAAIAAERAAQSSILEVKRALLNREDPALQRRYYQLQRLDLPAAQERAGFLRARLRSLPVSGVLERLAFFSVQARRFPEALSLYREVISRGDGAQITRARDNIDRINLTLGDGRLRKPLLDPRFER